MNEKLISIREDTLQTAISIVCTDRQNDYGNPEDNFRRIADIWSSYFGTTFTPKDVAAALILLKLARVRSGHAKRDNWIDIAGYAACGSEIECMETQNVTR